MEQPPVDTPGALKEYLTRILNAINNKDSQQLQIVTVLPTKPSPGRVYYFNNKIAPYITKVGSYVYKLVTAGNFDVGTSYTVVTIGTTNYTLIGGVNTVGTTFVATGAGTGTGTAYTWGYLG